MNTQRKVLVVDDDPVVARSFDRVLTGKGYAVISARDGVEALQKLKDEKYDLVFTDIKMPGMNGIEVAKRVKASQPWLPVVIVTGYGTDENEVQARAAGVAGFLRKPLSPDMIEGSMEQALHEAKAPVPEARVEAAVPAPMAERAGVQGAWKGFALMLAAPFIGLFYLVVGPLVGLAVLAWMGARAVAENRLARKAGVFLKNVGLFIAAPFIGLLYAMLFPFIGLGMLAWTGVRALANRPGPR